MCRGTRDSQFARLMLRHSSVIASSSQPGVHSSTSFCRHVIDAQHSFADRLPVRAAVPRLTAATIRAKGPAMSDSSHAYNSVWQLRGDAWCRLEEAADRLTRTTTTGALKEQYATICQ